MPSILVRDLDPEVVRRLKAAGKANGRSLQREIHEALRQAGLRRLAETRRLSAKWRRRLRNSTFTDSTALIREDRDAR
jgi:plasmid stability protein